MTNQYVETVAGDGGHYSINRARDGMDLLRLVFPDGEANEMYVMGKCLLVFAGSVVIVLVAKAVAAIAISVGLALL